MDVEIVLDVRARIGESPTWSPSERVLYWIDIKEPALKRYDPETGACRSWQVSSDLGAFALLEGGNAAVVALRSGIHSLDLRSGALQLLAPPPFDPKLFRFNEGQCDCTGRFWIGVMFDPIEGSPPPQRASLHSFTLSGGLRSERDCAELHNGMAATADGRRFFMSHSKTGSIYAFGFNPATGALGSRTLFAEVPPALGLPDGAAIDAEGGYWCAVHGGGRLRRYRADGQLDREILLPVSQPTMCAFAGDDLEVFYVTSASEGLDADQMRAEHSAGALLRVRPGVKGISRHHVVR